MVKSADPSVGVVRATYKAVRGNDYGSLCQEWSSKDLVFTLDLSRPAHPTVVRHPVKLKGEQRSHPASAR